MFGAYNGYMFTDEQRIKEKNFCNHNYYRGIYGEEIYAQSDDDNWTECWYNNVPFAEKLKKKIYPFPCCIGVEYAVTVRAINDIVKEMGAKSNDY